MLLENHLPYILIHTASQEQKSNKNKFMISKQLHIFHALFCGNNNLCLSQKKITYVSMESPLKDMNKQMRHCVSTKKTNATLKKLTSLFSGGIEKIHVMSEIFGSFSFFLLFFD